MLINIDKLQFKEIGEYQRTYSPCIIEEKIDGIRIMLMQGLAMTRGRNNWWDKMPLHIKALATDTPVDGELNWPGHTSTDVATGLKRKEAGLQFTAFYLPEFGGRPIEQRQRLRQMGFCVPLLYGEEEYINPPSLKIMQGAALTRKIEGWVLKERDYSYWWRIKLERTYDLFVTGFNIAETGRHTGKLKSLRCSAYINDRLTEVANVAGMTDIVRYAFRRADIGRVVEVRAQFMTSHGRLRQPRFIRWRDDKPAGECRLC